MQVKKIGKKRIKKGEKKASLNLLLYKGKNRLLMKEPVKKAFA